MLDKARLVQSYSVEISTIGLFYNYLQIALSSPCKNCGQPIRSHQHALDDHHTMLRRRFGLNQRLTYRCYEPQMWGR